MAGERSSVYFSINPLLGRLKSDGAGFRLGWNALVEWHDDTRMTMGVMSRLPDFDHRCRPNTDCIASYANLPATILVLGFC